ncbi:MAG: crossover junction endodeoxyribonuclease RuvC [Paraclostridium sp.]
MNNQTDDLIYCDNLLDTKYKKPVYWDRASVISFHVKELVDTFKPANVVIENAFMAGKTASSNMPLLMLRGIVLDVLRDSGCIVQGCTPSSARAFLGIKPNNKETAFEFIKNKYKKANLTLFKTDNDKSDAIICAANKDNPKNEQIIL